MPALHVQGIEISSEKREHEALFNHNHQLKYMYAAYKRISVRIFGGLTDRVIGQFKSLRRNLISAHIQILLKTWVSMIFLATAISYIASFIVFFVFMSIFAVGGITFFYIIIFGPILTASLTFLMLYVYPIQKCRSVKKSIELNLPFALAHMNAIVSSGIPPELMFELLTDLKEYGEIATHSQIIVRNIKTFGMSSIKAINEVAERTPSDEFRDVLAGISTTIEKGGNLVNYINDMSDRALFNYKIKREKYMKTLSTYAELQPRL